jgi:hypothetical protein
MSEDYFDVAWLNGEAVAILHGRKADGTQVYRPLNDEQKARLLSLHAKQSAAMDRLLREFAA